MEIRSDLHHWLIESLIAAETIDISSYDLVGRFTTGGKAALCGANESPLFVFMESAAAGEPVSVAFFGKGQVKMSLSGVGSAGDKLSTASGGKLVASGTTQSAEMDADDCGLALQDWTDGLETECFLIRGDKV